MLTNLLRWLGFLTCLGLSFMAFGLEICLCDITVRDRIEMDARNLHQALELVLPWRRRPARAPDPDVDPTMGTLSLR